MHINIECTRNAVTIEGVTIKRPTHVGVTQWLEFWEDAIDPPFPSEVELAGLGYHKSFR